MVKEKDTVIELYPMHDEDLKRAKNDIITDCRVSFDEPDNDITLKCRAELDI